MTRRGRAGGGVAAAVLAVVAVVPQALPSADAGWAGSLDKVASISAPDSPSRIVADGSGAAITGAHELRVVDANGDERWSAWFGERAALGPVALSPSLVVVGVDGVTVAALSRDDGTSQWEHRVVGPADVTLGSGAGDGTVVGIVSRTGVLEVLDGEHGALRWTAQLPVVERILAVKTHVVGTRVIVTWSDREASRIRAFDAVTGQVAWADDRSAYSSMPTTDADVVAFAVNDGRRNPRHPRGRMHALDVTTGEERWAHDVPGIFLPTVASAMSRRVLALVDLKGTVTAIDRRTHEVRWSSRTGRPQAEADPHVIGRNVALTTYGTGLQVLATSDGRSVANDEPGPSQTEVTIVASAAAGPRLYLLVQIGRVRGELWTLEPGE